ncbi:hypothetical protein ACMD2_00924 [Ananas comosus]|uniref:Uncharacterized protein n=1 Tax=Ananas comosus TaxID=4615 RepID=A0A199UM20_ANACO|nr:hypothetical protein ACMD2_00924 [Ananas comosus]
MKLHSQEKQKGGLSRALREQRAKLYIIRRCVYTETHDTVFVDVRESVEQRNSNAELAMSECQVQ